MKKTTIPFCKDIPDTWREIPNKYLFFYCSKKVGENWKGYQLLSLTTTGVKIKDINSSGGKVPDSYDNYQTVEPGDMIFCLFDLDVSAVFSGLSNLNGMITSAYDVVRPNKALVNQSFIDFWFRYVFSNRYYKMYSKNIRYTIGSDAFAAIRTPVPSLKYQEKISEYLNTKIKNIDLLIEIENKQTDSLKEYKQSLIREIITRGCNNHETKYSGIGWMGKISNNYSVSKVSQFYSIVLGKMLQTKPNENDTLENYLCATNVGGNKLKLDPIKQMWFSADEKEQYNVAKGDLLVVEGGDVGSCAIVDTEVGNMYIQNALHRVRPKTNNSLNAYLQYYLNFVKSSGYFDVSCNRATIAHFTKEKFSNLPFIVCDLEEQKNIVSFLDKKCNEVDLLIDVKQEKIQKLEEYKKSLIYECVTGKKEVAYEI